MHVSRILLAGLGVLGCLVAPARSQVTISSRTPFDQMLQYEPLMVKVKVGNNTGTPLMLGEGGNAKLDFRVERKPGYDVPHLDDLLLEDQVLIKAGATVTFEVDLTRAHDIRRTGPLTIIPRIRHAGRIYSGPRLLVEIVPGLKVDQYQYLVPGASGSARECTLRTLYRNHRQQLFLTMEDQDAGTILGVFDLGRMVSQASASLQSDSAGMIHVLHQSGPARFTHSVFRDNGQNVKKEYLSRGSGKPRLVRDGSGMVQVAGVQTYEGDPYIDRPVIKSFDPYE